MLNNNNLGPSAIFVCTGVKAQILINSDIQFSSGLNKAQLYNL